MTSLLAAAVSQPRKPSSRLLLTCIVTLVLAQVLIGVLSLAALNRLAADNTADRIELSARQSAAQIQTGLNLGKPLAQYFGLDDVLAALNQQTPGLRGASVVLASGHVLASTGKIEDASAVLAAINSPSVRPDPSLVMTSPGVVRQFSPDTVRLAVALVEQGVSTHGALLVDMEVAAAQSGLLKANVFVLTGVTLLAALLLALLLRYAIPAHLLTTHPGLHKLVPILILLVAQTIYAGYTIHSFRSVWLQVTHENAGLVVEGIKRDLDHVLSYGISPDRLIGVDDYLTRVAGSFPVIRELRLQGSDGALMVRVNADGLLATDDIAVPYQKADIIVPLYAAPGTSSVTTLAARLDPELLRAGVRARMLDAGTVAIIALVMAFELFLLLELALNANVLSRQGKAHKDRPDTSASLALPVALFARPLMFGFLFAWALPLGFLPLHARSLIPVDTAPDAMQFLMALPIVAEMGWGLLTVLLAGRLSDRYGWQRPVVAGLLISIGASVVCAMVTSPAGFVAARSLVGVGYGLTWMGLQGFVVLHSPAASRGRNMASIIAGLFAGHLSGVAVGAMLMQQLGAGAVFYAAALLYILPLLGALVVARARRFAFGSVVQAQSLNDRTQNDPASRKNMVSIGANTSDPARPVPGSQRPALWPLLFSRDFGLLLIASIVPFSIAQVGLLSFALPLYLEAGGFQPSSVGRVLMLYGLCVIYLGPLMGRLADRSARKKYWIVAAGLVGSAGLLSFLVLDGAVGAIVAVLCLAIASCLAGGAQTAYMLALEKVERYGFVGATSVMRAADKVGQMLGPLIVAALFAALSMEQGLAVTGGIYFVASLAFMLVTPRNRDHRGSDGERGP